MILKCVVIGPDRAQAKQLEVALDQLGGTAIIKQLTDYPPEYELLRMVRALAPRVVFLGLKDLDRSFQIVRSLQVEFAGLQIIAFDNELAPAILMKLMQNGIREYLPAPFELGELAEMLIRVREAGDKTPMVSSQTNLVYSFLPSKPGSGTTTLAVNGAIAMARQPDTSCLLMDLDLNNGMIRFMLKLENERTILDAAEHADNLDDALWPNLVSSKERMDILHAGKINAGVRLEERAIRNLIDYARKSYQAVCVDLSGNMEKYAIEVMRESKKIFVVCTPEIPSLHLAREKYHYLQSINLGDRVNFLLNRHGKNDLLRLSRIEELLGAEVLMNFPNDYREVNQAMTQGRQIDKSTELGAQISKLSNALLERNPAELPENAKKQTKGLGDLFKFRMGGLATLSDSESKG